MDLIISPHVDDEVLGCGGILNEKHIILHCGLSEGFRHGDTIFSKDFRLQEFEEVKKSVGCQTILLDHPVNNYSRNKLINDFERTINKIQPDRVYIPNPSYNQDHKEVYDLVHSKRKSSLFDDCPEEIMKDLGEVFDF